MTFTSNNHKIQQLATGDYLSISSYVFDSEKPGPNIYLQANLHGPEIFGTALLGKLMQKLQLGNTEFTGKLTIVPCANPIGVQQTTYNSMDGRWNKQNGTNWNRIFNTTENFKSKKEREEYYQTQLNNVNLSIEQKLSSALMLLSSEADYVIDIHTTGIETINHLFTFPGQSQVFNHLQAKIHVITEYDDAAGAFDEAHSIAFMKNLDESDVPKVCTWEASIHGQIEQIELEEKLEYLHNWLNFIWGNIQNVEDNYYKLPAKNCFHLTAVKAGYLIWQTDVGDTWQTGQKYGEVYRPNDNLFEDIVSPDNLIFIGKYGIGAIASGEQIAWVGKLTQAQMEL